MAGSPTPQPTSAPAPAPQRTTLRVWHGESGAAGTTLRAQLIEYQRDNPDVQIELEDRGFQLLRDYADAVQAGGPPDLVLLSENHWVGGLAERQLIADLTAEFPSAEQAPFAPAALEGVRHQGRLYGLPLTLDVPVLFFNRANFAPSGAPPATSAELFQAARGLSVNDKQGLAYNLNLYFTYPYLAAFGGGAFDAEGRPILATSGAEGARRWLDWLRGLAEDPQLLARDDSRAITNAIQRNGVLMAVDWARNLPTYTRLWREETGIAPLPQLSDTGQDPRPLVRSSVLALNPRAGDQQRKAALDVMRFLTGQAAQAELRAAGLPTVRTDLAAADDPLQAAIDLAASQGQAWPASPQFQDNWDILAQMVRSVLNGTPSQDAIDQAAPRLQNR
ncbi:MAG TPA: extracellular solute-binding protein [Herpetosiphonaceae bacterium]